MMKIAFEEEPPLFRIDREIIHNGDHIDMITECCPHCKRKLEYDKEDHIEKYGPMIIPVYRYKCPICGYTALSYHDNPESLEIYDIRNSNIEKLIQNECHRPKDEVIDEKKHIFVINGKGGVGKDFLVDGFRNTFGEEEVDNISSIDIIKKIASDYGWAGEKDNKSRAFLSDLKMTFSKYNDLPYNSIIKGTKDFSELKAHFLFVHIREPEEIEKYIKGVNDCIVEGSIKNCMTPVSILIKREVIDDNVYGNVADDGVDNYKYDFVYHNDRDIVAARGDFVKFVVDNIIIPNKKEEA